MNDLHNYFTPEELARMEKRRLELLGGLSAVAALPVCPENHDKVKAFIERK